MAVVTVVLRDGEGRQTYEDATLDHEHDDRGALTAYVVRQRSGRIEIPAARVVYVQVDE